MRFIPLKLVFICAFSEFFRSILKISKKCMISEHWSGVDKLSQDSFIGRDDLLIVFPS